MAETESKADRYAVVGHPVEHSRSPMIHQFFARQTGENMTYELLGASPEEFEIAVRGFGAAGGKGLNVTVPHKQAAFSLATERGVAAERARAVNTLTFKPGGAIRGDNTDGIGFMRDLTTNQKQDIAAKRVLILGAGGATRGILAPLLDAEPAAIMLANRTLERAEELVEEFQTDRNLTACRFDDLDDSVPFDLVVNATSAGVCGENPPFPPSCVGSVSFCYDLAYGLKGTPF
ncbi:MAG TPA: shikimate dehydrogenase, partial [Gammaproteobacteria bacterium]|nr:shikimate dehydrogenase [Gammaproteobacteria bacterium]